MAIAPKSARGRTKNKAVSQEIRIDSWGSFVETVLSPRYANWAWTRGCKLAIAEHAGPSFYDCRHTPAGMGPAGEPHSAHLQAQSASIS
jgi:hypothetical protein